MANNNGHGNMPHDIADPAELQRRFPRAGYWFGMLDRHPDIHPVLDRMANANLYQYAALPGVGAGPAAPAALPPHQQHFNPGYAGLQPNYNQLPPRYYPPAMAPLPHAPPPYYREPAPLLRNPVARAPAAPQADISHIDVSIPRNTEVQNGIVTRITIRLETDLIFEDFISRVCANMDLDPAEAVLGYKFIGDRVSEPPHRLSNADELQAAMAKGIDKIRRARSRGVVMEMHNLRAAATKNKKAVPTKSNKRSANTVTDENEENPVISYALQLRELKQRLFCQKHDAHCYINPVDTEHMILNTKQLTFWAKEIQLFDPNNKKHPPFIKDFDHVSKKPRTSRSGPSASNINVYVSNSPLGDATSRENSNRTPTPSRTYTTINKHTLGDLPLIQYPTITTALKDLHEALPLVDYPQYADAFIKNGVNYVNAALNLDITYYTDIIHMPPPIVQAFVDHAAHLVKRAQKGKGKFEVLVKSETDEVDYVELSD
ncbi:hypothetical protein BDZ97DRAFT_1951097 [Flammula alnicola]|nr:hypothetical protein BDZ97DRAFT_1951097 [Flammula alnicola]